MGKKDKKKPLLLPKDVEVGDIDLSEIASEYNSKKKTKSFFLTDIEKLEPIFMRTGLPGLDYAVGGKEHPGVPRGRIIEIFGGESSGKSTLSLFIMSRLLNDHDGLCLYFDVEQVYNNEIADKFNIPERRVLVSQPVTVEEVFEAQLDLTQSFKEKYPDKPLGIVFDSVAACLSSLENKGDMEDKQYGGIAKELTKGLRKINPIINEDRILSIYVNQLREKIGAGMFEEKTDTPGGKAMKFFASVRIECRKSSTIKDKDTGKIIGHTVSLKCKKNKVAPPLREATFDIYYESEEFIDYYGHLLDWLYDNGLAGNSSGYYEINGKKYRKTQAIQMLKEDEELYEELLDLAYTI